MLIGLAATTADGLDSLVDQRFGRCEYFVIVDPDTMEFRTLRNSGASAPKGACQQAADLIVDNGVEVVMAGNVGDGPLQTLSAAGVEVITGVSGTVGGAVNMYKGSSDSNDVSDEAGTECNDGISSPHEYGAEVSVINEQMDILEGEFKDIQRRLEEKE